VCGDHAAAMERSSRSIAKRSQSTWAESLAVQ
jgi:hypothetical protein